jgi:hypothetical protein
LKHIFKNLTKSAFVTQLIGLLAYWYIRFVALTTKWDRRNVGNFYDALDKCGSVIFVAWHGRMPMLPFFWDRRKTLKALVSPHRDGRMIVGLLKRFGIGHIDGSSNENASKAAVTLYRELTNGTTIAIIPDGPRGPSMTLSMSPIYYAQKTGKPVIGVTYAIEGSAVLEKSWDRMLLPKPFHRGICDVTKPMFIPQDADKEALELYRRRFENELNELTWKLDRELGLPYIEKGTCSRKKDRQNNKQDQNAQNKGSCR